MFFCWIKFFKNTFFISASENVYSDTNIPILRGLEAVILTRIHVDLVGSLYKTTTGVSKIFFSVGLRCLKILFFCISTPENVYLDKNISILGGLEAEILIRTQIW